MKGQMRWAKFLSKSACLIVNFSMSSDFMDHGEQWNEVAVKSHAPLDLYGLTCLVKIAK